MPKITDAFLKSLQTPHRERVEVGDSQAPGLRVRSGKSGGISFVVYLHAPEGRRVMTIGHYPAMSLAAARDEVRKLQAANKDGQLARALAPPEVGTVAELAALFTENLKVKRKHPKQAISVIEKRIVPVIGGLKVADVRWGDVLRAIEPVAKDVGPVAAKKVFDLAKQMMGYAVGRDLIPANVCANRDPEDFGASPGVSRDRVLSAEEIGLAWEKFGEKGKTPSQRGRWLALRLLMLLPSRPGAVCRMAWKDVDLDRGLWTVPLADRKLTKKREAKFKAAGDTYTLPLGPSALAILAKAKATGGGSRWVFPVVGEPEKCIDPTVIADEVKSLGFGWHPHDLRRTIRTGMRSILKAPGDVAEAALDHVVGTRVERTYNRADLTGEIRETLLRWEGYVLDRAAVATTPNVVALTSAAS